MNSLICCTFPYKKHLDFHKTENEKKKKKKEERKKVAYRINTTTRPNQKDTKSARYRETDLWSNFKPRFEAKSSE